MDTGCQCLVTLARLQQIPAEYAQLRHQFSKNQEAFTDNDLLRAGRAMGFKARKISSRLADIDASILPAIAKSTDGSYFIIARLSDPQKASEADHEYEQIALVLEAGASTPKQMTASELEARWNGELILLTKREGILEAFKEFDIRWFIPAMLKYRKLFGEVLLASFFI